MALKLTILIIFILFVYQIDSQSGRTRSDFPSYSQYVQTYKKNYTTSQMIDR